MAESLTEPKRRMALDTDWLTALNVICAFVACGLIGTALMWTTLQGSVKVSHPSWATPLFAGLLIYVAVKDSGKVFRTAVLVFAIGPVSRIVLWLLRASIETQLINEIFVRWVYVLLSFAGCAYSVYWFKTKIRHV